jgi:hypothetical protein
MMDDADEAPLKRLRPSGVGLDDLGGDDAPMPAAPKSAAAGGGGGAAAAAAAAAEDATLALRRAAWQKNMDSVLKLYVMQAEPNYAQPWQARPFSVRGPKPCRRRTPFVSRVRVFCVVLPLRAVAQVRPQRASTGSGFVLDGRRILTNAHGAARAAAPAAALRALSDASCVGRGARRAAPRHTRCTRRAARPPPAPIPPPARGALAPSAFAPAHTHAHTHTPHPTLVFALSRFPPCPPACPCLPSPAPRSGAQLHHGARAAGGAA